MRVYIIKASEDSVFKEYKQYMSGPPQNIFAAAAATPEGVEIEMTDETMDMKVNFETEAELIAIFMSTPDALRAYDIAKHFKRRGKTVVFGGLHASFLPEEALQNGDAVIIGELEGIWEILLEDFKNKELKERYQRNTAVDLKIVKPYPTNIIHPKHYKYAWSVLVGRGCGNACTYCTVWPFFKNMRFRPIENIVEEIKKSGTKWIELHADNLTADREYAKELFKALKPLEINWEGETTINFADDEELLHLAAESGLKGLTVGLETPSRAALDKSGKGFVSFEKVQQQVERFHQYGIMLDSAFLFGFDEHNTRIFEETYDFVKEINLDSTHSVIVIPFPGTAFFNKMQKEGRILTENWSKYDGAHAVFQPKQMSAKDLEYGAYWFHEEIQKLNKHHIGKSGSDYNWY